MPSEWDFGRLRQHSGLSVYGDNIEAERGSLLASFASVYGVWAHASRLCLRL